MLRTALASPWRIAARTLPHGRPALTRCLALRAINTSDAEVHPPFARYVHGMEVSADAKLIFTSGQLGIAPDGTIPPSAEEQTELALKNVSAVLNAAGASLGDVVRLNAFVTGREHLQGYMRARDAAFADLPPKASTLMIVSGFARPEFVVEVEAIAAKAASPAPSSSSSSSGGATPASVAGAAAGRRGMRTHAAQRAPRRSLHGERVPISAVDAFVADLRSAGVRVLSASDGSENDQREIKRRSRDFYWYSPILKPQLAGCVADALVLAQSEADVVAASEAAVAHGVPLTPRGAGTGNYGQAMPLRGGAVLDVSGIDAIEAIDAEAGTVRAGAGIRLGDLEDACRAHGWELRQHPSTRRTATLGGFVAGGSTGHGALLHGGLSEDGAVLSVRVVTAEAPKPRVLELHGRDVFPVVHAYGTNGVITSVEVPLARAQPWTDVTASFSSLDAAAAFALDVANAPAIVKRAVTVFQAPLPHEFLDADSLLHTADTAWPEELKDGAARHVCLTQCAAPSVGPLERLASERGGVLSKVCKAAEASRQMYEFGWNHTTLHALKRDKAVTYLQSVLEPERAIELVGRVEKEFSPSELMQHLEVVNFNGRVRVRSVTGRSVAGPCFPPAPLRLDFWLCLLFSVAFACLLVVVLLLLLLLLLPLLVVLLVVHTRRLLRRISRLSLLCSRGRPALLRSRCSSHRGPTSPPGMPDCVRCSSGMRATACRSSTRTHTSWRTAG